MPAAQLHLVVAARQLRRRPSLAAALLLGGCYTYRPPSAPVPAAGSRVQLTLTDTGMDSLAGRIGPDVGVLYGNVVRADTSAVTLAVVGVDNLRGVHDDWQGESVTVPRRFVRDLQERRLSVGGTGLLGGAIAASLVAATAAITGGGGVVGGGTATSGPRPQ